MCNDPSEKAKSMIFVEIASSSFNIDIKVQEETHNIRVVRWQFPLTHAMVRTAYSCQGLTLDGGIVVDLRRGGGLQDDDWWLNIYVMLSRARRLDNLILLGLSQQVEDLLRKGPPERLVEIVKDLKRKAKKTMTAYEQRGTQ